ncbi:MAG: hypothetical protein HY361_02245 [Candidatus Aenigmarchaeota archaeon]|nr:hypothetical protein [Candidatus Aenigmarchaeota archaeon]
MNLMLKLKGKDKYETLENYSILLILLGGGMLSMGMGLTAIFSTKGITAILAMLGSLIAFLATTALIFIWLVKEFKSG